jgi:hypothetical protein
MVSTVAIAVEPRPITRTTAIRAARQRTETKSQRPARSFLTALLRSLSAFAA